VSPQPPSNLFVLLEFCVSWTVVYPAVEEIMAPEIPLKSYLCMSQERPFDCLPYPLPPFPRFLLFLLILLILLFFFIHLRMHRTYALMLHP
jgi:hypothetical protein